MELNDAKLEREETAKVQATYVPTDAYFETVLWESSDPTVATVDNEGNVTAHNPGKTTITAYAYNGLPATCEVTVPYVPTGVALNADKAEIHVGMTEQLTATVTPEEAEDKSIRWSSSEESVATVDGNGLVTTLKIGTATITATTHNGLTATCEVNVIAIPASGLTLNTDKAELTVGTTVTLEAFIEPENTTDKTVTWTSGNEGVATVGSDGAVSAIAPGTTVITATSHNGLTATCSVTVVKAPVNVEGVEFEETSHSLMEGETYQLTATVTPEDADDKTLTWYSSDTSVATVDDAGLVTALTPGTTVITATSVNGIEAVCEVTVMRKIIAVIGVSLDREEANIKVEETVQLKATITPDDATDPIVLWSSSDESVATVNPMTGEVKGVGAGTAVITATAAGNITAHCTVNVTDPSTGIEEIITDTSTIAPWTRIYTLNGMWIDFDSTTLQPGIYIIVTDGKAEKVLVK